MTVTTRIAVVLIVLFSLAACGSKEDALRKVDVEQAMQEVLTQAQAVATLVGSELVPASATRIDGCTGKNGERPRSVYSFHGAFRMFPPKEKMNSTVEQAHDYWVAQGLNMRPVRWDKDGLAYTQGTDPTGQIDYSIDVVPDYYAVVLEISGPCYEKPSGEAPYGPYTFRPGTLPSPSPSAS